MSEHKTVRGYGAWEVVQSTGACGKCRGLDYQGRHQCPTPEACRVLADDDRDDGLGLGALLWPIATVVAIALIALWRIA